MYAHSLSGCIEIPQRAVRDLFVMLRYPTRMKRPRLIQDLDEAERAAVLVELVELTRRGHLVAAGYKLEGLAGVDDEQGLQWPRAPWDAATG